MKCTIFTQYFSPKISRRLGRRVSRQKAELFSVEKMESALKEAKAKYESRDARYPRAPWIPGKMFIVDSELKKGTVLKIIERKL